MEKFRELGLDGEILKGVADLGFETPSPVQEKTIPVILGEENDLVVLAQTGTGKTAAFGLPLLQKIEPEWKNTQVLVLSPTRELCVQIGNDLKNYSKYRKDIRIACVYGGTDIRRQIKEIERGVHVIVATPGRLVDLLKRKVVDIESVVAVVLDEADEMLNMGFQEDLNFILEETPKEKNTYLFSATMPKEVERIARNYLINPKEISVGKKNQGADTVSHHYYMVRAKDCYETLRRVIDCAPDMYAIIFTRTKNDASEIAKHLQRDGIDCDALHGDLSQAQRDNVMAAFRSKRLKVLVATDVAARGLDVDCLTHVINYNLPDDVESYTHRSGRTGRAGKEGISIAIIHSKEKGKLRRIENMLKKTFVYQQVPGGEQICKAQLAFYADQILAAEQQDNLENFEQTVFDKFADYTKEELIQHLVSFEFGKLLKKYKNTDDLNLSEKERSERGGREGRGERRGRGGDTVFSAFSLNIGREDGLTPKDLMALINKHSRRRGVEVGGIRIYDTDTKFEIDEESATDFASDFSRAVFNGIPLTIRAISNRNQGGRGRGGDRDRGGSRSGRGGKSGRDRFERRDSGKREKEVEGKRRGKPGSNPKKPRNFRRSSAGN
ncbi:DEAD/DEAH box helicase [uncultured Sanguibacteroides sp.]|uniref:DEAD/DEAH box helicase n=1 Tax=uncultured Sanguibacteroides sp. TaxID=1635151 RepID=UPI0025E82D2C|nr:DEAD/DEAH box helicase [uncultured Sanguibacteroides sp.]